MSVELTWLGHGTWMITTGEHRILLDPFLDSNPSCPTKAAEINPTLILVSHGHADHVAELVTVAQQSGAQVISVFEITQWLAKQGISNTVGMNIGGGYDLPFGRVKLTPAVHSSVLPDGTYAGNPAGILLSVNGKRIYFACDTDLFSDMQLVARGGLDLAVLPIGDLFTMGPDDAVEATKLLKPKQVAPAHYNTFPPIQQDAAAWAEKIKAQTDAEPLVIQPGEKVQL